MSAALPPIPICPTCSDATTVQIPGPAGAAGTNGTDGDDGLNAFTTTTADFIMPAIGADVVVSVVESRWIVVLQVLIVQGGGYMQVMAVPAVAPFTSVTLRNLGYSENPANPADTVASGALVSPTGPKGLTGASGAAGTLNAISPTQAKGDIIVDDGANAPAASAQRFGAGVNGEHIIYDSTQPLGVRSGKVNLASAAEVSGSLALANGGTAGTDAATARTNLGLGTMAVQNANAVAITGGSATSLILDYQDALIVALDVDWATADTFAKTLAANVILTFSNDESGQTITVAITQSAGGGNTVTWPATVKWTGGIAPTMTATASAVDVYTFVKVNGVVYGSYIQDFS